MERIIDEVKDFSSLREKYSKIIYQSYQIIDEENDLKIEYQYEIPGLSVFKPYLIISKEYILNKNIEAHYLIFSFWIQ